MCHRSSCYAHLCYSPALNALEHSSRKMYFYLRPRIKCFICLTIAFVFLTIIFSDRNIFGTTKVNKMTTTNIPISEKWYDKWIIVTTTNQPNSAIEKLATISGWRLLVVGDLKTPSDWRFPNCTYIGINQQKALNYSIISHIPFDSYTRKNIGYLYAINHGAEYIYDTDDATHPFDNNIHFSLEPTMSGLIYEDTTRILMNPYAHFGQPTMWPRGFPPEKIEEVNNNTYRLINFVTPTIQQGLVYNDSSEYSFIKDKQRTSSHVKFDDCAPPVTLPVGVFSPINSRNTLFHRDAFWALMLPYSVSSRIMDTWRGYWAQKLMWLVDQRLAFFPSNAVQISNPSSISDAQGDLKNKTPVVEFVQFLSNWNCTTKTLFGCINQLSSAMVDYGFWNLSDYNLVKAWLADLKNLNYKQPELQTNKQNNEVDKRLESISLPKANQTVYFSPSPKYDSLNERRLDMLTFCNETLNSTTEQHATLEANLSYSFPKTLLVILFNKMFFKNIKFLDTLYRDHFPNIAVCTPMALHADMIQEVKEGFPQWRTRQITFLNMTLTEWFFAYECAIRVIEMNYRVSGYLVIGDDTLLNFWNLPSRNLNEVHFLKPRFAQRGITEYFWKRMFHYTGQNATGAAFDEIEKLANSTPLDHIDQKLSQIMKTYVETRLRNKINMTMFPMTITDIYYIPQSKAYEFMEIMKIFLKHKSFLEMANPATMAGLYEGDMSEHVFRGKGFWNSDRDQVFSFFKANNDYLHPLKLSQVFQNASFRHNYCDLYIRQIIEKW